MADDSNFDSRNEDHWKLYNKDSLNSLSTQESGKPQNLESNKINHLLDQIVCNQYSSENELGEVQLRRINSAIYAEPIRSQSDDSTDLTVALSNISIDDNQVASFNTYRCEPCISSTALSSFPSTSYKSKSATKVELRCRIDDDQLCTNSQPQIQRYALNGRRVIHVSTSLTSFAPSNRYDYRGFSTARNLAHLQWLQRKKTEIVRKKSTIKALQTKKKVDGDDLTREEADHERRDRKNYSVWMERKKREHDLKRRISQKELELENRLDEIVAETVPVKEFHIRRWTLEKKKMVKAKKLEQELEIKKREEEKRKRMEESSRAFELWCKKSKNRPRPATQGLLPHQRAIPSYVNPIPWIVDDALSETR